MLIVSYLNCFMNLIIFYYEKDCFQDETDYINE